VPDLEATTPKRNISGEDLEVAVLDYRIVKAGEVADLPVYYAWHTDDEPALVGYSPDVWADAGGAIPPDNTSNSSAGADSDPQE